jgi:hypothetical protein
MRKSMNIKLNNDFLKVAVLSIVAFVPQKSYTLPAYIPQELRECVWVAYDIMDNTQRRRALESLYETIKENRMFTSDTVVVKGIEEILEAISHIEGNEAVTRYLEDYLNNINNRSLLLSLYARRKKSI